MGCGSSKEPEKQQKPPQQQQQQQQQQQGGDGGRSAVADPKDSTVAAPPPAAATSGDTTGSAGQSKPPPGAAVAAVATAGTAAGSDQQEFEPNPAQAQNDAKCCVTATCWSPNEKFFFCGDEKGRVTCWSAFVPYQRKWCKAVPKPKAKQALPSIVALIVHQRLDTANLIIAVDNVGNAWAFDVNSGNVSRLASLRASSTFGAVICAVGEDASGLCLIAAHSKGVVSLHTIQINAPAAGATANTGCVATALPVVTLPGAGGCDVTTVAMLEATPSACSLFAGTTDGKLFQIQANTTADASNGLSTAKAVPGFALRACVTSLLVSQVLSPKRLVVLDDSGRVSVWAVPTGSIEDESASAKQLAARSLEATTVAISRDDRYVFCFGQDPTSPLMDLVVLDLIAALDPALSSTPPLATVGALNIADLLRSGLSKDDEATTKFDTLAIPTVAQSVNGLILIAGTGDCHVAMIDLSEFVKPDVMMHHRGSTVGSLTVAGGGGKFGVSASEDTTIKVWELLSGRPVASLTAHTGRVWSVTAVKFGPTSTPSAGGGVKAGVATGAPPVWIASGAEDGTMRLWGLPTGKQLEVHSADRDCVWSVASEDGAIFTGGADGVIRVWLTEGHPYSRAATEDSGKDSLKKSDDDARASFVGGLRLSGGNLKRPAKSSGGSTATPPKFTCWAKLEGHTAAVSTLHAIPYVPHSTSASPSVVLISGSFDTTIRVWHLPSCRCVATVSNVHTDVVWAVCSAAAFHPRCKIDPALIPAVDADYDPTARDCVRVFSAGEDRTVQCYELDLAAAVSVEARTTSNVTVMERVATFDADAPVASIALLDAQRVACGTANSSLVALEASTALERVAGKYGCASSLVPVFMATGVHPGNASICSMVSTKHCLLTGGVDGTVRYHSPWPALKDCSSEGGGHLSVMQRKARMIMAHVSN